MGLVTTPIQLSSEQILEYIEGHRREIALNAISRLG